MAISLWSVLTNGWLVVNTLQHCQVCYITFVALGIPLIWGVKVLYVCIRGRVHKILTYVLYKIPHHKACTALLIWSWYVPVDHPKSYETHPHQRGDHGSCSTQSSINTIQQGQSNSTCVVNTCILCQITQHTQMIYLRLMKEENTCLFPFHVKYSSIVSGTSTNISHQEYHYCTVTAE